MENEVIFNKIHWNKLKTIKNYLNCKKNHKKRIIHVNWMFDVAIQTPIIYGIISALTYINSSKYDLIVLCNIIATDTLYIF